MALDTNALYVAGSASDLVRKDISDVIVESKYPDLDILWYLPEIVRHERQYQMQTEALKLRVAINKIERLLGHNLALPDRILLGHVETKIDEAEKNLGLQEIKLDHNLVDWSKLMHAAAYRKPPFEVGDKEKGFRDALVAESFLQLVAISPKTPNLCRVVLITADALLGQAVKERICDSPNASVLANLEELKGLINTIVSNVGEEFIAQINPKAARQFFVSSSDKDTIFYKERIKERLEEKFKSDLEAKPSGCTFRANRTWFIEKPNFSKKVGRRVSWTSRIEIEVEAGIFAKDEEPSGKIQLSELMVPSVGELRIPPVKNVTVNYFYDEPQPFQLGQMAILPSQKRVVTQKGKDVFEVLWSTEVTMSKELRKATIEDIIHIGLSYQPISS